MPFQWCCIESPLCHLYLNKRPLDRCQGQSWSFHEGYIPPKGATQGVGEQPLSVNTNQQKNHAVQYRKTQHSSVNESLVLFLNPSLHYASPLAMVYGSLHFTTFDGTDYAFKALGEFVILRLSSSSGSNIFTLQGQTDKRQTDAKVPGMVRMAAFHQGIGKVGWPLKIKPSVVTFYLEPQVLKTTKTPKTQICISFQIEWRCAAKADRLWVLVDGVEVPVKVGKEKHT